MWSSLSVKVQSVCNTVKVSVKIHCMPCTLIKRPLVVSFIKRRGYNVSVQLSNPKHMVET